MANVYYGDYYTWVPTQAGAGNWNNPNNWYSSVGSCGGGGCCCNVAGMPLTGTVPATQLFPGVVYTIVTPGTTNWVALGAANNSVGTSFTANSSAPGTGTGTASGRRIPNPATDTVILTGNSSPIASQLITTGPSAANYPGGYSGAITCFSPSDWLGLADPAAVYTGAVAMQNGQYAAHPNEITAGKFYGTVTLGATSSTGDPNAGAITGGTFYGTVVRAPISGLAGFFYGSITGGTYSPSCSCTLNGLVLSPSALPADPGFAIGGGTFAPIINVVNAPAILAAGFPT